MSARSHYVLLALGTNANDAIERLKRLESILRSWWNVTETTTPLRNPAIGLKAGTNDFHNQLIHISTTMTYDEVFRLTKCAEKLCNRTEREIVDVDIMAYDDIRHHQDDWQRPYIKQLLAMMYSLRHRFSLVISILFIACLSLLPCSSMAQDNDSAKDLLSKAIEYFSGKKYQEALLTFNKLGSTYKLSPRMTAYLGVCYFKTGDYENAIKVLSPVVDSLNMYAPHEQSIYYYSLGESNFQLGNYFKTVPCFEKILSICNQDDRAEVCYRLGFSQWMCAEYEEAIRWFREAEKWYKITEVNEITKAHREQGRRMLNALVAKYENSASYATIPPQQYEDSASSDALPPQ